MFELGGEQMCIQLASIRRLRLSQWWTWRRRTMSEGWSQPMTEAVDTIQAYCTASHYEYDRTSWFKVQKKKKSQWKCSKGKDSLSSQGALYQCILQSAPARVLLLHFVSYANMFSILPMKKRQGGCWVCFYCESLNISRSLSYKIRVIKLLTYSPTYECERCALA